MDKIKVKMIRENIEKGLVVCGGKEYPENRMSWSFARRELCVPNGEIQMYGAVFPLYKRKA